MIVRFKLCIIIGLVPSLAVVDQAQAKRRANKTTIQNPSIETTAAVSGPVWVVVNLFTGASSRQAVRYGTLLPAWERKGAALFYRFARLLWKTWQS